MLFLKAFVRWPGRVTARFQIAPLPNWAKPDIFKLRLIRHNCDLRVPYAFLHPS